MTSSTGLCHRSEWKRNRLKWKLLVVVTVQHFVKILALAWGNEIWEKQAEEHQGSETLMDWSDMDHYGWSTKSSQGDGGMGTEGSHLLWIEICFSSPVVLFSYKTYNSLNEEGYVSKLTFKAKCQTFIPCSSLKKKKRENLTTREITFLINTQWMLSAE